MSTINRSVLATSTRTAPRKEGGSNSELMSNQLSLLNRFKVEHAVDQARPQVLKEAHQRRLKQLRKELEFIKNSNWLYQPIEKYIGQ